MPTPPAAALRKDSDGYWLCNAAADCDNLAVLQWPYTVTEDDVAALRELCGVPQLRPTDTVPVFGCDDHLPVDA